MLININNYMKNLNENFYQLITKKNIPLYIFRYYNIIQSLK